jgi:hypothetical protein
MILLAEKLLHWLADEKEKGSYEVNFNGQNACQWYIFLSFRTETTLHPQKNDNY